MTFAKAVPRREGRLVVVDYSLTHAACLPP